MGKKKDKNIKAKPQKDQSKEIQKNDYKNINKYPYYSNNQGDYYNRRGNYTNNSYYYNRNQYNKGYRNYNTFNKMNYQNKKSRYNAKYKHNNNKEGIEIGDNYIQANSTLDNNRESEVVISEKFIEEKHPNVELEHKQLSDLKDVENNYNKEDNIKDNSPINHNKINEQNNFKANEKLKVENHKIVNTNEIFIRESKAKEMPINAKEVPKPNNTFEVCSKASICLEGKSQPEKTKNVIENPILHTQMFNPNQNNMPQQPFYPYPPYSGNFYSMMQQYQQDQGMKGGNANNHNQQYPYFQYPYYMFPFPMTMEQQRYYQQMNIPK